MKTKTDIDNFLLTHWPAVLFLLHYAAGTLFTGCPGSEQIIEMIKCELEDGKELEGPGSWAYEISKLVEQQNSKKIFEIIQQVASQLKGGF